MRHSVTREQPTRRNNFSDLTLTMHLEYFGVIEVVLPVVNSDCDAVLCQLESITYTCKVGEVFPKTNKKTTLRHLLLCCWLGKRYLKDYYVVGLAGDI